MPRPIYTLKPKHLTRTQLAQWAAFQPRPPRRYEFDPKLLRKLEEGRR